MASLSNPKIMRFLPLFLLLLACQTPSSSAKFDTVAKKNVASEAIDMLKAYHEAIRVGGLSAEFAYLDSSSYFFWIPPNYDNALDFDSVKTILLQTDASIMGVNFNWEKIAVYPIAPELATYHGIVTGNMIDTSGTDFPVHILESGTLIKRPDGWKLLSGQSVNLTP